MKMILTEKKYGENMITKFLRFINEDLNFDFDENDWSEIEKIKTDTTHRRGEFLPYEIEYFEKIGLTLQAKNMLSERTPQYRVSVTKRINAVNDNRFAGSTNPKKEPFHINYHISLTDQHGNTIKNFLTGEMSPETPFDTIKPIVKRILKEIYIILWEKGWDPEAARKQKEQREKSFLKHKDEDPYGEEKWEEDEK
jgi:hypothetical protein